MTHYTEEELAKRVTVSDIRKTGQCVSGQWRWFQEHGFDFRRVMKEGVTLRELHQTGDGEAEIVVKRVIQKLREARDG